LAIVEDSWFSLEAYSRSGEGYAQSTSEVAIIPDRIEPGELAQRGELSFSDVADIVEDTTLQSAPNIVAGLEAACASRDGDQQCDLVPVTPGGFCVLDGSQS
jgi:hypothetical protein